MRSRKCAKVDKFAGLEEIDSVFRETAPKIFRSEVFDDGRMGIVEIDAEGLGVSTLVFIDQC